MSTIFVSYSHLDRKWLDVLIPWLEDSLRRDGVTLWYNRTDETGLQPGAQFEAAILAAIDAAEFALLLVSESFFASTFIQDVELPRILQRAEAGGLVVIPILLEPGDFPSHMYHMLHQMLAGRVKPLDVYSVRALEWGRARHDILEGIRRCLRERRGGPPIAQSANVADDLTMCMASEVLLSAIRVELLEKGRATRMDLIPEMTQLPTMAGFKWPLPVNQDYILIRIYQGSSLIEKLKADIDPALPPGTPIDFHISVDAGARIVWSYRIGEDEFSGAIEPPDMPVPTPEQVLRTVAEIKEALHSSVFWGRVPFERRMQQLRREIDEARTSGDETRIIGRFVQLTALLQEVLSIRAGLKPPADHDKLAHGDANRVLVNHARSLQTLLAHLTGAKAGGLEPGGGNTEMPFDTVDDVNFSVSSPPSAKPGAPFLVGVWAHLEHQYEAVVLRAKTAAKEGEIAVVTKGPIEVARGTVLVVYLKIEGLVIDNPQDTLRWQGGIGNVQFRVRVPPDARPGYREGTAEIFAGGLQIARVLFDIVVSDVAASKFDQSELSSRLQRHETAFASYASKDRDAVLARVQGMLKVVPHLNIFLDVVSLRSGQDWEHELMRIIPASDVFYLFWSDNARRSEWVEKEWRCALSTRGPAFIDPVPLASPNVVPPPPELAGKHFNDWVLAFMRTEQ